MFVIIPPQHFVQKSALHFCTLCRLQSIYKGDVILRQSRRILKPLHKRSFAFAQDDIAFMLFCSTVLTYRFYGYAKAKISVILRQSRRILKPLHKSSFAFAQDDIAFMLFCITVLTYHFNSYAKAKISVILRRRRRILTPFAKDPSLSLRMTSVLCSLLNSTDISLLRLRKSKNICHSEA